MNNKLRCAAGLLTLSWLISPAVGRDASAQKSFASAEEACQALATAVTEHDTVALDLIFWPEAMELKSPDPVEGQNELAWFAGEYATSNHIAYYGEDHGVLEIGPDRWPFAVPLARKEGRWIFDTRDGKEEILNRRVGYNEIETIETLRACAEAQREYASLYRDDNQVLQFSQKFVSTPGHKDGLYWQDFDGEISPLGPLLAEAQAGGYFRQPSTADEPQPLHGYYFKVLTRQGKYAPGGAYNYVINGNMIGGFAFVAWPSDYGRSGVMTFIINQQGRVFERDMGVDTTKIAGKMKAYNPDAKWALSAD